MRKDSQIFLRVSYVGRVAEEPGEKKRVSDTNNMRMYFSNNLVLFFEFVWVGGVSFSAW